MHPKRIQIPEWMQGDPKFSFGKPSGQSPSNRIDDTINNVYLKESLKEHIANEISN